MGWSPSQPKRGAKHTSNKDVGRESSQHTMNFVSRQTVSMYLLRFESILGAMTCKTPEQKSRLTVEFLRMLPATL
jgi:hypothetical protein